jgi:uncharacterized membrane protein HdeD (DUF308 family)
LEPVEARILLAAGTLLLALSVLFAFFPRVPAYALVVVFGWIGLALLYGAYKLHHGKANR